MVQQPLEHLWVVGVDTIVKWRGYASHGLDRGGIVCDDSPSQFKVGCINGIVNGWRSLLLRREVINWRTQVERTRCGSEQSKAALAPTIFRMPAPFVGRQLTNGVRSLVRIVAMPGNILRLTILRLRSLQPGRRIPIPLPSAIDIPSRLEALQQFGRVR